MLNKSTIKINYVEKYFFTLFAFLPIAIVAGPAISLINIVLIDISFIIFILFQREYKFFFKTEVKIIFTIFLYLIFNNFISLDNNIALGRNFGFIRFLIFFIATNYFFNKYENFQRVIFYWFLFIIFVVSDIFFEVYTGKNYLGYGEGDRIYSFFLDEPVVGGFINSFYLMFIGYLFQYKDSNFFCKKNVALFLIFIFLFSVIVTGERANSIRAVIGISIFLTFFNSYKLKHKVSFFLIAIFLTSIIFSQSEFLKLRYKHQLLDKFSTKEKREFILKNNPYMKLQKSGLEVFKDNILFGVGNKNYRVATCHPKTKATAYYYCGTHPHQTIIEFLSEHGIVGTIFLFSLFFILFAKAFKKMIISRNQVQLGCFIYILITFIPLLPSGAFFGDSLLTSFWINTSVLYAVSRHTNIFQN